MTAKEEDILTSMTLLQNGLALERLLDSIIVDKNIRASSLFVGDRNAIVISARVSGYGNIYRTEITCPECVTQQKHNFNLNDAEIRTTTQILSMLPSGINVTDEGLYSVLLPKSQLTIVLRLLTGGDENQLSTAIETNKKQKSEKLVTTQLAYMISSVNGNSTREAIEYVSNNLPSSDSAFLRSIYKKIIPNVDLNLSFSCENCPHTDNMEVPLTAEFFWPEQ